MWAGTPTPDCPALKFHGCRSIVSLLDIFEIDNNTFATVLELVQVGG